MTNTTRPKLTVPPLPPMVPVLDATAMSPLHVVEQLATELRAARCLLALKVSASPSPQERNAAAALTLAADLVEDARGALAAEDVTL